MPTAEAGEVICVIWNGEASATQLADTGYHTPTHL